MPKRRRVIGTTTEVIEQSEKRLGRKLPPSFKAWLLKNNGTGEIHPAPDEREPRTLAGNFFHERENLMDWVTDCFEQESSTVEHLLPIAEVGDGDRWCFDLDTVDSFDENPIVRWSHETNEVENVADNFVEFIQMFEAGELED